MSAIRAVYYAVIAPASPPREGTKHNFESVRRGVAVLEEQFGFLAVPPAPGYTDPIAFLKSPERNRGYLAGSDETRRRELSDALAAAVDAHRRDGRRTVLMCARGGYGCARQLEKGRLDPVAEARRPDGCIALCGYSDVTVIHFSFLARGLGCRCVHGPMLTELASEPLWSRERLRSVVCGQSVPPLRGTAWRDGIAEGRLIVGNLCVATTLIGTAHMPDVRGAILVFEDLDEPAYRIDRYLTQWRLAGLLQAAAGVAFGHFTDCIGAIDDLLRERTLDLPEGIPVVGHLQVGHHHNRHPEEGNAALPLGTRACLNGFEGTLTLLE